MMKKQPERDRPAPLLNERLIMDTLDKVSSPMSASRLQDGCTLAITDAFDRKIDREPFVQLLGDALNTINMLSRISAVSAMLTMLKEDRISKEKMEHALKVLTENAERHRKGLVELMDKVRQCPTNYDPIH